MVSAMSPLLHPRAWLHPRVWWVSGDHSELLRSLAVGCVFMVVGLLLPRPKFMETRAGLAYTATGLAVQRFALGLHGLAILRELWCACTRPGTAAALTRACGRFCAGQGWSLSLPPAPRPLKGRGRGARASPALSSGPKPSRDGTGAGADLDWYITPADLAHFHASVEPDGEEAARADPTAGGRWELMMPLRSFGRQACPDTSVSYAAWRRPLADGKTEYKSTTLATGISAREFTDFYLDDRTRSVWDGMVVEQCAVEAAPAAASAAAGGAAAHRALVVRWLRSFPFSFISDREYVIARRVWADPGRAGAFYTATRALPDHPAVPRRPGVVRMETFYSVWRCRDIPHPGGGPAPACEVTLLHREDFQIPERLARFAVRAGMAGFVAKLPPAIGAFVAARRARGVGPDEADPAAYGVGSGDGDESPAGGTPTAGGAGSGAASPRAAVVSFAPADTREAARLRVVASTPALAAVLGGVEEEEEEEEKGGGGGGGGRAVPAPPASGRGGWCEAAAGLPPRARPRLPATKSAPLLSSLLTRVGSFAGLAPTPAGSPPRSPRAEAAGGAEAAVPAAPALEPAAPAPPAAATPRRRRPSTAAVLLRAVVVTAVAVALAGRVGGGKKEEYGHGRGRGRDHHRRRPRAAAPPVPPRPTPTVPTDDEGGVSDGVVSYPLAEL